MEESLRVKNTIEKIENISMMLYKKINAYILRLNYILSVPLYHITANIYCK